MYKEHKVGDLVRIIGGGYKGRVYEIKGVGINFMGDKLYLYSDEEGKPSAQIEPVTHLTTKEFIKLVKTMGLKVSEASTHLTIMNCEYVVAEVYKTKLNKVDTTWSVEISNELFKVLCIYTNTPLELREEKEQLYTLELPNNNKKHIYFGLHKELSNHYRFGKLTRSGAFKCIFTQKEIDELPNQELIKLLKQVPVNET